MTRIIKLTEEAENWLRHKPETLESRQVVARMISLLTENKPKPNTEKETE